MKIIAVRLVRAFGLREYDFKPNGKSVIIKGRNGAGKSSLLRGIEAVARGTNIAKRDDLRDGIAYKRTDSDGNTDILLQLGETDLVQMEIERRWDPDGKAMKFTARVDGIVQDAPKRLVESIVRSLTFNPVAFYLADDRARRDMVMKSLPVSFEGKDDFWSLVQLALLKAGKIDGVVRHFGVEYSTAILDQLFDKIDPDFDTEHALEITSKLMKLADTIRTDAGQQSRMKHEALLAAGGDAKRPEYDLARARVAGEAATNAALALDEYTGAQAAQTRTELAVTAATHRVTELEAALRDARVALADREGEHAAAKADADFAAQAVHAERIALCEYLGIPVDESIDLAGRWQGVINEFEVQRRMADAYAEAQLRIAALRTQVESHQNTYALADDAVAIFRDGVPKLLTERAKLPIPGLAFTDEGILVDGIPIERRSSGEKMTFALLMAEAQLRDGDGDKIEAMLIDGAELLDPERFDQVEEYARDNRVQLIMTKVDRGDLRVEELA